MGNDLHNLNVYTNKVDREFLIEVKAFLEPYKINLGRVVIVCLRACWSTIKKELPKKRTFKLNGEDITP